MRKMFFILLVLLCIASVVMWKTQPAQQVSVPVLYWITDANPARRQQVRKFHEWLVANGKTRKWLLENPQLKNLKGFDRTPRPDDAEVPCLELKTDFGSSNTQKKIIQGVSGIGGDIMDISSGGGEHIFFDQIGLLEDVSDSAEDMGFSVDKTWPGVRELLITEDFNKNKCKQVAFPCNVATSVLWSNVDTFKKLGLPIPAQRMTIEEFEALGKEFVKRANAGKEESDRAFFVSKITPVDLCNSMGRSTLNETLTLSTFDTPEYIKALTLVKKWTDVDRLIPSHADMNSLQTASSYGGPMMGLFAKGRIGMLNIGRYGLIQFRKYAPPLNLKVHELPHGGFPCTSVGTRAAAVYSGGKYKPLAKLFLTFLASEQYNQQIVEDADALPPNPSFAHGKSFDRPALFENEWNVHAPFRKVMEEIAIPIAFTPFAPPQRILRQQANSRDGALTGRVSPQQAARDAQKQSNLAIQRALKDKPLRVQKEYQRRLELQKQIDQRVAALKSGDTTRLLPRSWIYNPFYRIYYEKQGWLEPLPPTSPSKTHSK